MNDIIPAILVNDEKTFRARVAAMEHLVPLIHLDILDGKFAPYTNWFDLAVLAELQTPVHFELHLMVNEPASYIQTARTISSIQRLIWHIEAAADHHALIRLCHEHTKEAGLGICPPTPLTAIDPYHEDIDELLILGGPPGRSGQVFDPQRLDIVRDAQARFPALPLGFDIGVNETTIPEIRAAGVQRFCAGSAIFEAKNPTVALQALRER
jgi:ribulose-phosphate 3-epimerase